MRKTESESDRDAKIMEVAALMLQHGLGLQEACELVEITDQDVAAAVERRLQGSRELPWIPTPAMIKAQCEQIRRESPRPMVGFALPSPARTRAFETAMVSGSLCLSEKST